MRRSAALALIAILLSWNLTYPPAVKADDDDRYKSDPAAKLATKTPIKHLVVIFDENISFDHYFGTYPNALNLSGETSTFHPAPDTPLVNGLTPTLLNNNPNALNGGSNPFRLGPSLALTCNNNNGYTKEQQAFDGGLLDKFSVTSVGAACGAGFYFQPNLSMGYFDGNTVTALWNYAQHYSMSDNFFDTLFGTTVMGHMNLLSGQTHGFVVKVGTASPTVLPNGSIIANVQPYHDDCAAGSPPNIVMTGKNVGDLLNAAGVSWGWFYGDFAPVSITAGVATCTSIYNNHYAPFDYYQSTANPHHIPPVSLAAVGTDTCSNFTCANHNYDLNTFYNALSNGVLPAVTYLKFAENDTGHAADSSPLLEQASLVTAINAIEQSPFWWDTAIIITYDDTGGWYDHAAGPIVNFSEDPVNDAISGIPAASGGSGSCGKLAGGAVPSPNDRCGLGVRMPFLLISPPAKRNYVDHSLNDTTSVLRFIEYNWSLGTIGDPTSFDVLASGTILGMFDFDSNHGDDRDAESRKLILDPTTGEIVRGPLTR
jgi:phospholipase C